ncbi:MAG: flagellin [Alphaproteobacteria bacterium]
MPVVGTNTAANSAIYYLNQNSSAQEKSLAYLSSGSKIVSASDDASGLAVSTQLASDISVLEQGAVNAQQGQSVLNVADGALSNIGDILQRMKSLAAQSMSGSVSDGSRAYIDAEFAELVGEIDAIVASTRFDGALLIDSSYDQSFLVGTDAASDTIQVDLTSVTIDAAIDLADGVDTAANAVTSSGNIDTMIDSISTARSLVGAYQSRMEFRFDVIETAIDNLTAARSTIVDTDIAEEQSNYTTSQVMTQVATAALAQANNMKTSLLSLVQ